MLGILLAKRSGIEFAADTMRERRHSAAEAASSSATAAPQQPPAPGAGRSPRGNDAVDGEVVTRGAAEAAVEVHTDPDTLVRTYHLRPGAVTEAAAEQFPLAAWRN